MYKSEVRQRSALALTMALALAAGCWAQDGAVNVLEALDSPAELELKDVTLADALDQVGQAMGVPVSVDPEALRQLSHAGETRLAQVRLLGMSWSDALRELLEPMLLTYEPATDNIYVTGARALMRQPEPVNSFEREALVALERAGLTATSDKLLGQIRKATKLEFALVENGRRRGEADDDIVEDILTKLPQSGTQVLNEYSRQVIPGGDGTWYVKANVEYGQASRIDIIVLSGRTLTERKLGRRIDVEFKNVPVPQVLQVLAESARVELRFEPGCLALLDQGVREKVSLTVKGGTVRSALEAVSGLTGLEFTPVAEGVRVSAGPVLTDKDRTRAEAPRSSNPTLFIIQHQVPGTNFQTMIVVRQQDLAERGLLEKYQQYQEESMDEFLSHLEQYEPDKSASSQP